MPAVETLKALKSVEPPFMFLVEHLCSVPGGVPVLRVLRLFAANLCGGPVRK